MADLPAGEPGAAYTPRWPSLKTNSRLWGDGPTAREFLRGALHPTMAKELYCTPTEALVDRTTKSFVWVSDRFSITLPCIGADTALYTGPPLYHGAD